MKIELPDDKVLRMAEAIKTLRELEKNATPTAPTVVMAKWSHCDQSYQHGSLGAKSAALDRYRATCFAASCAALAEIKDELRAIADGKEDGNEVKVAVGSVGAEGSAQEPF